MINLDSDVLIEILNVNSEKRIDLIKKIEETGIEDIRVSSIVLEEVLFGIFKKVGVEKSKSHPIFTYPVVIFGREEAIKSADIEVQMEKMGMKKPHGDVLIAATAIHHSAKLFTLNERHYSGIPGLNLI